jgi:hypothetical protein
MSRHSEHSALAAVLELQCKGRERELVVLLSKRLLECFWPAAVLTGSACDYPYGDAMRYAVHAAGCLFIYLTRCRVRARLPHACGTVPH